MILHGTHHARALRHRIHTRSEDVVCPSVTQPFCMLGHGVNYGMNCAHHHEPVSYWVSCCARRCNVDMLKLIQLGLTFTDAEGNLPTCNGELSVWQFNFKCALLSAHVHAGWRCSSGPNAEHAGLFCPAQATLMNDLSTLHRMAACSTLADCLMSSPAVAL